MQKHQVIFLSLFIPLVSYLCLNASLSSAAIIAKISKNSKKIVVELSRSELLSLEEDTDVLIEISKPIRIATAKVLQINLLKKKAMIALEVIDPNLKRYQEVRFISFLSNPLSSYLIISTAQHQQYQDSSIEPGLGGFYKDLSGVIQDTKTRSQTTGRFLQLYSQVSLTPFPLGVAINYDYRLFETDIKSDVGSSLSNETIHRLRPSMWIEVEPEYFVSFNYDYTTISYRSGAGVEKNSYDYSFFEPQVGFIWATPKREIGFRFKSRAKFTAYDSDLSRDNTKKSATLTRVLPAQLEFIYREAQSPQFLWGGNVGYEFFERNKQFNQPFEPKSQIYEGLFFYSNFEHRLTDGQKIDWRIALNGAKVSDLTLQPRGVNTLGGTMSYYKDISHGLIIGSTTELALGLKENTIINFDQTTGEEEKITEITRGGQAYFLIFARYHFDRKNDAEPGI